MLKSINQPAKPYLTTLAYKYGFTLCCSGACLVAILVIMGTVNLRFWRSIKCPGETYATDLTIVDNSTQFTHRFVFLNPSFKRVKILDKVTSCTCTKSELSNTEIGPGEECTLDLAVTMPFALQDAVMRCVLKTDLEEFPEWEFKFRVRTIPRWRFEPNMLDVGTLSPSDSTRTSTVTLHVYDDAKKPMDNLISSITSSSKSLSSIPANNIRKSHITNNIAEYKQDISFTVSRNNQVGTYNETLSLTLLNGHRISLPVIWRATHLLVASPSRLHFGILNSQDTEKSSVFTIRSGTGEKCSLLNVTCNDENIRLEFKKLTDLVHVIKVYYDRKTKSNGRLADSGSIQIQASIHKPISIDIPWSILIRSAERANPSGSDLKQ